MQKWVNMLEVKCEPSREKEFEDWYANMHLPDALKTPGFVAARQYRIKEFRDGRGTYLHIYNIETEDIAETMKIRREKRESEAKLGRASTNRNRLTQHVWLDVLWRQIAERVAAGYKRTHKQKWVNLVEVNCSPSREDEFHDWYDHVHLPDILSTPDFVGARRYVIREPRDGRGQYLTIYYVETDDIQKTMETCLGKMEAETGIIRSGDPGNKLVVHLWRNVLWKQVVEGVVPGRSEKQAQLPW